MLNRTLLALSLSTLMMGSAYAQSLVEQPLTVQTPAKPLEPLKATVTKTITVKEKPAVNNTASNPSAQKEKTEKKPFFKKKEKEVEAEPTPKITTKKLEPVVGGVDPMKKVAPAKVEPVKTVVKEVPKAVLKPVDVPPPPQDDEALTIQPLEDIEIDPNAIDEDEPKIIEPTKVVDKNTKPVTALTLQALNNAQWSENLSGVALKAFTAKAQVLLDNAHTTPGAIDGQAGNKMSKAIRAFQIIHKLDKSNSMNQDTWNKLVQLQGKTPAFVEYTITATDVNKNLYVNGIPDSYEEKSKMSGLKYTRTTEMLGEKFHLDENFLRELNPHAKFVAGEKIIVPNVHGNLPEDISVIIAMKEMKQVYLFNSKNQMVGSFPATVGKETTPSPSGTLKVTRIAKNPWYTKPGEKSSLPAGPNTPVGNVWIALSKPSYGIHGTPEPSKISNDGQGSAGCVRLTNWDANRLATAVKPGVTVIFRDDSIKR